jgi:hypothetical protein
LFEVSRSSNCIMLDLHLTLSYITKSIDSVKSIGNVTNL